MRLDRVDAQVEQIGYFLAGLELRHQLQDFALAGREQLVGVFHAGALQLAHVVLEQDFAYRRTEERLPAGGGTDGARQVGFGGVLEQVGLGAGLQGTEYVPFVGVHTEHDNLGIRQRGANLAARFDAVQAWHADIHNYYVRFQFSGHGHGFTPVTGFSDHREVGLGIHHHAQSRANQSVVVGKQDAGGLHALPPPGKGNSAVTAAPFPGCDSTRNVPPSRVTRSSIPNIPIPRDRNGSKPRPSSVTRTTMDFASLRATTFAFLAPEWRTALLRASWTSR